MAAKGKKRRGIKKRKYILFLVLCLCAALAAWQIGLTDLHGDTPVSVGAENSVTVHFIDVGQGDTTLIQMNNSSVLIDGGDRRTASSVVQYLKDAEVDRIDYMITTHPHADHISGLVNVLDAFKVDTVIMPKVSHNTQTFKRLLDNIETKTVTLQESVPGNSFNIGETVFTIVAPNSTGYKNLNNYSVSVHMSHGNTAFLFTGDAEAESENEMLKNSHKLSANVLHAGHHGSNSSTTQSFLDAVSPEIAVISCGAGNSYGHPHKEVLERLEKAGVTVYRTDLHGTIVMTTNGNYVRTY